MIGIAFSPTLGSMSAIPKPCKSTSITMCFDDEGRHHGGSEEPSVPNSAPNPPTPACMHNWHRSLASSSLVPLPPPSPTPTLPATPVLARPLSDETDETDAPERPVLARPLSDETDETDVLERPLLARPLSDETDETFGRRSGEVVAGRRRGSTCHRAKIDAIRGHQTPSEVIRRHQRSSDAIRGHQTALASLPGAFIYRNQTPSVRRNLRRNLRRTSTELAASTCCCRSRRRGVSSTLAITVSGSSSGAPN